MTIQFTSQPSLDNTSLFHNLIHSQGKKASTSSQQHLTAQLVHSASPHATSSLKQSSPFITSSHLILKEFNSIQQQIASYYRSRRAGTSENAATTLELPNIQQLVAMLNAQVEQLAKVIRSEANHQESMQTHTQREFYKGIVRFLKGHLQKRSDEWQNVAKEMAMRDDKSSGGMLGFETQSSGRRPLRERESSSHNVALRDSEFMETLKRQMSEGESSEEQVALDEQLESQMLRERQFIHTDLLDETQDIMHSALELSELNAIFMEKAREQYEQIETMHTNVEHGVHNVEQARQVLSKTDKKQQGAWCSRFWVAYVFLVCSALLLLMDFIHA